MKITVLFILIFYKVFCFESQVDVFTGEFIEEEVDLVFPFVLTRTYNAQERTTKSIAPEWQFNLPDLFEQDVQRKKIPDLSNCKIVATHDENKRLQEVFFFCKEALLDKWRITYEPFSCRICCDSGNSISYFFDQNGHLEKVEKNGVYECSYSYMPHPKERRWLVTTKQSANGDRLEIEYSEQAKVKKLSYFKKNALINFCCFVYEADGTEVLYSSGEKRKCRTSSTTFYDEYGQEVQQLHFDSAGNLIKETVLGNLSGQGILETYSKTYTYSPDHHLLEENEDNGRKRFYKYDQDRLVASFLLDHETIILRSFYSYDENGALQTEVHDNGQSLDPQDFANILFRNEKHYGSRHFTGKPEIILEKSFDPIEKTIKTIKRIESHYSLQGRLLEEKVFTANNDLLSSQEWTYSANESHVHFIAHEGEHYKSYDFLGNLIYEWDCKNSFELFYHYQHENLLKVEKRYFNGNIECAFFAYDTYGNLVQFVDAYGNQTSYVYDNKQRQIAKIAPPMEDLPLLTSTNYNPSSISITDPKGFTTTTTYNSRKQPVAISHPDGSEEYFTYFLDGKLHSEQKAIFYEYDALDNVIKKITPQETISYQYAGKLLTSEYSSLHGLKHYTYDATGQLTQMENCQKEHVISFSYDYQGKLREKVESFGQKPEMVRHTCITDHAISIHNHLRECFVEKSLEDEDEITLEENCIVNAFGQTVLEKRSFDEYGNHLIVQYNAYNLPVLEIKEDPFKRKLYVKQMRYDASGNKIQESYLKNGKEELTTVWVFGPMNLLEETIESVGTPHQKSHRYEYNNQGQLTTILKPDGIAISYEYDALGNVSRHFSSDHTIDYAFSYDAWGNLILAKDLQSGLTTIREYDEKNQLIKEALGNGLSVQNGYDAVGRRNALYLHDGSSVFYEYDALFLRKVLRNRPDGKNYSHSFLQYDLNGHLQQESLIGSLGDVHLSNTQVSTPYHTIQQEGHRSIFSYPLGIETAFYTQDALGQITSEKGAFEEDHHYDSFGKRSIEHLSYDSNGNIIKNDRYEYRYDALNRLTQVTLDGDFLVSYLYDCFHRRIAKTTSEGAYYFLYDGLHEIGKATTDGVLIELRILGNAEHGECGATVAVELNGIAYAPLHDLHGSIVGLVNASTKGIEELYHFSAFGKEKQLMGNKIQNPWRYAGKRIDEETGLIFFGRRFYSPELGSWITPDPSGYRDGPNLYLFAKNDPLHNRDAYGLFSFKAFLNILFHPLEHADRLFGKLYHYLSGYGMNEFHCGVYGKGEVSDKVRVTAINGMITDRYWLMVAVKALSASHGGVNIHYVHRPPSSNGLLDAYRAHMVRHGVISPHARHLADTWKELIHEMGGVEGGGLIIHYAHSIGTCETMAALGLMTEEEQKMIKVYSFGSPCLGSKKNYQIHHFVSVRDGISLLFDLSNFIKAAKGKNKDVTFVGTFLGVPFVDHLFLTKSYVDVWSAMGKTFVEWYGSLL